MNDHRIDNAGRLNAEAWADLNYQKYLPKEYRRHLRDYLDKRFVTIWLVTFIIHFSSALYFAAHPPDPSINRSEIDRIQKQFATLVLEREIKEEPIESGTFPIEKLVPQKMTAGPNVQGGGDNRTGGSYTSGSEGRTGVATSESDGIGHYSGSDERQSHREQISREVSSKGLLGLLTGSGSNAKGEAITDLLGDAAETKGDIEKTLGDLEGLKRPGESTAGAPVGSGTGKGERGHPQKGTRDTTGGRIDDLITERGQAKATDIQRQGSLVVEKVSAVADERGLKSESRDADEVSEVINGHNSSIQYCYQRELKLNPDLKGKLVVRFTISPEGKVKDIQIISSTLNNPGIERCVISRIRRWDDFGSINPAKGDATFRQVYTFGY